MRIPSSYVELVVELLAETPHDVMFIVLNYDTLLESALKSFDPGIQFDDIGMYVLPDRSAKIVKLHGSVNWFARIPGSANVSWDSAVTEYDVSVKVAVNQILVKDGIDNIRGVRDNERMLYPILTAPLAGKGVCDAVCPQNHIVAVRQFLGDCQKFLIIGTSGLDEDLLAIVDSALTDHMKYYHVHVVDVEKGADDARNRFMEGIKAFKNRIPAQNVWRQGFRGYLQNGLRSFSGFEL